MAGRPKILDDFSHIERSSNRTKKRYPEKTKQQQKNSNLKTSYGITKDDYDRMFQEQNGQCAICETKEYGRKGIEYFCVDHDHVTGKIRGLLCNHCNWGLGRFKEDLNVLKKAVNYMEQHYGR